VVCEIVAKITNSNLTNVALEL